MNKAMITMESAYLSSNRPKYVSFKVDQGAPLHVLRSIITGRDRIGTNDSIVFKILNQSEDVTSKDELLLTMTQNCSVIKKK